MKLKYFLLSLFSVCVVVFAISCANSSGGGTPSNNSGGDKPSTEIDIKGVWSTGDYQKDNITEQALLAFDENFAYHAHMKEGVLDAKGQKFSYKFENGVLSIPTVEKMMTFVVAKDKIILTMIASKKVYEMHKITKPTLDELKAICK